MLEERLPNLFNINPRSTGLFAPVTALGKGGGGCFPPPSVKLDPDILES